jgi:outer membrane protein assembly factor BamB
MPHCRLMTCGLLALLLMCAHAALAQYGAGGGEWRAYSADEGSTRYSPLDEIHAENFEQLEVAWIWRGDNFGPSPLNRSRSTPTYADGILYTVAGDRRTVVAIDPATGEILWTYREPHTTRWERSTRKGYGKGVAYAEVDGRGVVYVVTPAFFLHALDAETGRPLEGANIALLHLSDESLRGMSADQNGFYQVSGLQPGRYVLRISYIRYEAYEEPLTVRAHERRATARLPRAPRARPCRRRCSTWSCAAPAR